MNAQRDMMHLRGFSPSHLLIAACVNQGKSQPNAHILMWIW
jgi:hypothetical protein